MIVAIDGPSGAGKSSMASKVASNLGFSCMDTGAMFRCIALKALSENIELTDNEALGNLAIDADIDFKYEDSSPYPSAVILNGRDVTNDIRTFEIDNAVTPVCQQPSVRNALLALQRELAKEGNFVIDGRDIGTVVFPNAEVKIYLDATAEERARRRVKQNEQRNVGSVDFDVVLADIQRRDFEDMNREFAPLKRADDAFYLDSTNMSIDDVLKTICNLVYNTQKENANHNHR